MKKRILGSMLVFCIFAAFMPCIVQAETGTKYGEYLYYEVNADGTGITITDCDSNASGAIVIPDEIKGLPVTEIGDNAFFARNALEEITIPDSVTSIGDSAFYFCENLKKINLPQSLEYIGDGAFLNCYALESELTIPDGVTSIGDYTFNSCTKLKKITLPQNLTHIGDSAFCQCYAWEGELTIPDGVTSIGNDTFNSCTKLKKITLPQNLTHIGDSAFCQCYAWEGELTIPDGVTSIGNEAFRSCDLLTSVYIPENVEYIGDDAFNECNDLAQIIVAPNNTFFTLQDGVLFNKDKTVLIKYPENKRSDEAYIVPDGVKELSMHALANNSNILGIILPETLEIIGEETFEDCNKLTEITIPAGVTTINSNPFNGCDRLRKIYVNGNNRNFCDENGILFDKNKTRLIQYPTGRENTEYSIPDTVHEISESAFCYCKYLTYVTIPGNVTSIGMDAFVGCKNLKRITISEGIISIGSYAFDGCEALTNIGLPGSVTSIGYGAFHRCMSLTNISIPKNVTSIDYNTFSGCTALTDVYYSGSETEWGNIDINKYGNDALKNASIHYNAVGASAPKIAGTPTISESQLTIPLADAEYDSDLFAVFSGESGIIDCERIGISAGDTKKTAAIPTGAQTVKVFIWDSINGMKPLCEAVDVPIK